jgi:hypothetical protein
MDFLLESDFPTPSSPSIKVSGLPLGSPLLDNDNEQFFLIILSSSFNSLAGRSPKMGLMLRKPEGTPGKSWPAISIGLFVAFGGVLFG